MKVVKIGKYTMMRHWFKWYWIHQNNGGSPAEFNYLVGIDFAQTEEIE